MQTINHSRTDAELRTERSQLRCLSNEDFKPKILPRIDPVIPSTFVAFILISTTASARDITLINKGVAKVTL